MSVFSEAAADEICRRVAAGESMSAVCRTPGMPERSTLGNWAQSHPEFGMSLRAAMRQARLRQRVADGIRAALIKPGAGRPSTYNLTKARAICERIANGETATSIGQDPDMPCFGTIMAWLKRHPEFADMYAVARQTFADFMFDEARDVARASTHATVWSDRLQFDTIRWMTARMAPKKYCERVMVEAEIAARRDAEDPDRAGMTVIVKSFADVTPEEEAAADYWERRLG